MNTNQTIRANYYERLCRAYDTAVELKDYYKSVGDMDNFWRYMRICLDLIKSKMNYSKN